MLLCIYFIFVWIILRLFFCDNFFILLVEGVFIMVLFVFLKLKVIVVVVMWLVLDSGFEFRV